MKKQLELKNLFKTIMVVAILGFGQLGFAQVYNYDFGLGTGTANNTNSGTGNTTFLTATPANGGTYRIRIGTGGGAAILANPGTTLGSNSEIQLNAGTGTSTNKFSVHSWTSPSTVAYVKAKLRTTSSANGNLNFSLGTSIIGSDNQGYTNHYNASLTSLIIPYTAGAIGTVARRVSGANTTITSSGFAKDTNQEIEVYANNGSNSANYFKSGTTYSLATRTWDLWVDGVRVVTNGATAGTLAVNTNLSGFAFFAESSTSNAAFIYLDDLEYSNALPVITWNGSVSNLWSTAANWTPAVVPTISDDVLISSGTPILDQNFTIGSGRTLVVNGTGTLTVNPTRVLTISGSAAFNARPIIFKSDSNGTGSFGAVVVPANVTGATNVTVERFLQGRRAVRFLTPSVTTSSSIRANWQNGGVATAGLGTHITGSITGANGFDSTLSGNPSMFTYNAQATGTASGFSSITNTNVATLNAGAGYRILIRGDRNVDLTAASADNMNVSTTLSSTGALTLGTVTFNATSGPSLINNQAGNTQTAGFTLIGNPFASPVDWHAVTKTGVAANAYYTWDPTLGTTAQRGRYVVYSQNSALASLLDDNSNLPINNRRYLQTGQAVFIKNADLNTPAILTFEEDDKASNYQYAFRLNQTNTNKSTLFLSVFEPNELALGGNAVDGALAVFNTDFSNNLDSNDVEKLLTTGENVAFSRGSKNLAIETVATAQNNDLLFIKTIAFVANKNYTFKMNPANFDASLSAKLLDSYLNIETPLSLSQPSFVNFSTNSDVASYASERFKIVFNSGTLGNDAFVKNTISVYPNPVSNNQFTVALPTTVAGKVTLVITNMIGQRIYDAMIDAAPTMEIQPKKTLQNGVYIVNVTNNGSSFQMKIIVKN